MSGNISFGNNKTINIYDAFFDAAKRWWVILIAVLTTAMFSYVVFTELYSATYTSEATLVVTYLGGTSALASNDISETKAFADVLSNVFKSDYMNSLIAEKSNFKSEFTVSAAQIPETNLISVSSTSNSPIDSYKILKSAINNYCVMTDEIMGSVAVQILTPPNVPLSPSNPMDLGSVKKTIALSAFVFIVIECFISFFKNTATSDTVFKNTVDAKLIALVCHEKKIKTFGSLKNKKYRSLLITSAMTSRGYSENNKELQGKVETLANEKQAKVIMVTATQNKEGTTTVASNLALAFAQKFDNIYLIDCNLRHPEIKKTFGIKNIKTYDLPGAAELNIPVSDAFYRDPDSGLNILCGLITRKNYQDVFTNKKVVAYINKIRESADYIFIDAPVASEAKEILSISDASILVVRQNAASIKDINASADILRENNREMLGCIFNNVSRNFYTE